MNHSKAPLFEALMNHVNSNPISFHVPGHKSGGVFPLQQPHPYEKILKYDLTEIEGLDDLHQAESAIKEAEDLAADLYGVDRTFFLVNGTTSGNLAMILAVCKPQDKVLVQRNSHKSIMHGLELAGAKPIFFTPEYDKETKRFSYINQDVIKKAIDQHHDIKAIILTYPDYFGTTYDLELIVRYAHEKNIPVLVDEAHGAHFILGKPFPKSAIECGADVVVHSAHKTLPAMTMGSYLHIRSNLINEMDVKYYLQVVQTSSPSYPILASLDLARKYIAEFTVEMKHEWIVKINDLRQRLNTFSMWDVLPVREGVDDPLKITLTSNVYDLKDIEGFMNRHRLYPEMVQNNQLLLVLGLQTDERMNRRLTNLKDLLEKSNFKPFHGTMANKKFYENKLIELQFDYGSLKNKATQFLNWDETVGKISATTVTPYPPGIPVLVKGEEITKHHVDYIKLAIQNNEYIQFSGKNLSKGIEVFLVE